MPDPDSRSPTDPTRTRWLPWRWPWLPWLVAVPALVAGLPLFLRMPPWCDLTLYDVAARNLLAGGVHYRDVFDTNLPGFVWLLAGVRAVFGWSTEAVRLVDLAIVVGVVGVLDRLAVAGGADRTARAWAIAGAALLYPFIPEFNHAQRDVWMTLPAAAAVVLRCRRLAATDRRRDFAAGFLEGVLWGAAVWIKPHVVVPAAAVWLATAPWVGRAGGWRGLAADLAGNVLGGGLLGGLGIVYLIASGTWPHMYEVFDFWNTRYFGRVLSELPNRWEWQLIYFPPWSTLQPVGVLVAFLALADGLTGTRDRPGRVGRALPWWAWDAGASAGVRSARVAFAALYLGWVAQALFFQRQFHYAHVPETLMILPLLATQRWAAGAVVVLGLLLAGAVVDRTGLAVSPGNVSWPVATGGPSWAVRHPILDADRMAEWPDCWRADPTPAEYRERRDAAAMVREFHPANSWAELGEVADWLTARGATCEDVICWHDAPHALYLGLPGRPRFRFMHVNQMLSLRRGTIRPGVGRVAGRPARDEVGRQRPAPGGVAGPAVRDRLAGGRPGPAAAGHGPGRPGGVPVCPAGRVPVRGRARPVRDSPARLTGHSNSSATGVRKPGSTGSADSSCRALNITGSSPGR